MIVFPVIHVYVCVNLIYEFYGGVNIYRHTNKRECKNDYKNINSNKNISIGEKKGIGGYCLYVNYLGCPHPHIYTSTYQQVLDEQ